MALQPLLTPRGWGGEHLWAAPPRLPLPLQSPLTASARLPGGAAPGSEPACCPHTAPSPGPILSRAAGLQQGGTQAGRGGPALWGLCQRHPPAPCTLSLLISEAVGWGVGEGSCTSGAQSRRSFLL